MRWSPIPTFPGYWASDDGRVRSTRGELVPWTSSGYLTVGLRRDGSTIKVHVHRLILMAFTGLPEPGLDGCHIDGDRLNNAASNLYWGTRSQNIRDQVRHGRHNNARKTHCPQGHPYSDENTYVLSGGRRQCKTCSKAKAAEAHARKKASA